MNLSTIIEKKKNEFEVGRECTCGEEKELLDCYTCAIHGKDAMDFKDFLEKAIRESVEEALLEVGNFGEPEKGCDGCEMSCGHALMDFKERVKEFMK